MTKKNVKKQKKGDVIEVESTEIIVDEEKPMMPTAQPATSMIQVIERAATDPNVDMDKMERLLAMKERLDAKEAETEFNQAMSELQSTMGRISADSTNPQTHSQYATYAKLDAKLRPMYTAAGFSLSFDTEESPIPETIKVVCYVSHTAGHTRTYKVDMAADGKGAKGGAVMSRTHAAGSAMSYGMRYLLKMIFNVAVGEDDDDGNQASVTVERITEDQVNTIHARITDNGVNMELFLKWLKQDLKCDSLENISLQAYDHVNRRIDSGIRAAKKKADKEKK